MSGIEWNPESHPDFEKYEDAVHDALAQGLVRPDIPCDEFRRNWLAMARGIYVNGEEPEIVRDLEIGMHGALCEVEICQLLMRAYRRVLTTDLIEDKGMLSRTLDELEKRVFPENN